MFLSGFFIKEVYKKGHDKNFLLNLKHFILLTIFIKLKMQPPSHFIQFWLFTSSGEADFSHVHQSVPESPRIGKSRLLFQESRDFCIYEKLNQSKKIRNLFLFFYFSHKLYFFYAVSVFVFLLQRFRLIYFLHKLWCQFT